MRFARLLLMAMVFFNAAAVYAANFTDNGNGTISDGNTGFVWQKDDDGTARTWDGALTYCEGLSLAGQTDWRLPNKLELMSIVDYTRITPSINTTYFPNTKLSDYWSSTTDANDASYAWYVNFDFGYVIFTIGSVVDGYKTHSGYVRCVRGGQ